jgi:hypothetical protein
MEEEEERDKNRVVITAVLVLDSQQLLSLLRSLAAIISTSDTTEIGNDDAFLRMGRFAEECNRKPFFEATAAVAAAEDIIHMMFRGCFFFFSERSLSTISLCWSVFHSIE